jgi:glycosyltransferase involved in cell wall biosynthesis
MISVVIPAFNAGRFIKRTVDSILAQTYRDYEVIVVDDASTDNTSEAVKSYGSKVRYIYQENAGDGPARNTGIHAARGEWIAFLDHDDEWLAEKLRLQFELLDRNPDLRWCAANFYKQSDQRRTAAVDPADMCRDLAGKDYFESFFGVVQKRGFIFLTTTMLVHREAFEQAGFFDSCWLRCADLDMWWRIAYRFPAIGYVPQPLAILHIGAQDMTSTRLRLETKRGEDGRRLIARHLQLAAEHGQLAAFKPCARDFLRKRLVSSIYHGFKTDSRITTKQFAEFFPWYWRIAVYVLTIFPRITSTAARSLAYLRHKLGLERDVSRRWVKVKAEGQSGP